MVLVYLAALVVVVVVLILSRMLRPVSDHSKLHVPDWKRGVVYLMQFPVSPKARSMSPFAVKLETWLRLVDIPYENRYTLRSSRKGQIPFIEYNGTQYPDSNLVIQFLKREFGRDPDSGLDESSRAVGHALKSMVEQHTTVIGFYWRYGFHMSDFREKMMPNLEIPHWRLTIFSFFLSYGMRLRGHLQGIGRHSMQELDEFSFEDLHCISVLLGDKTYLFGDRLTTTDCALFGNLVQFLYVPLPFPQKQYIRERCPNLVSYVDRIRDKIWPDWTDMCDVKCMEGKKSPLYLRR